MCLLSFSVFSFSVPLLRFFTIFLFHNQFFPTLLTFLTLFSPLSFSPVLLSTSSYLSLCPSPSLSHAQSGLCGIVPVGRRWWQMGRILAPPHVWPRAADCGGPCQGATSRVCACARSPCGWGGQAASGERRKTNGCQHWSLHCRLSHFISGEVTGGLLSPAAQKHLTNCSAP